MANETKTKSEAKRKADNKWNAAHLETLGLRLKKGVNGKVKAISTRSGTTMVAFVSDAIKEKSLRENLITEEQAGTLFDEDLEGKWVKAYEAGEK